MMPGEYEDINQYVHLIAELSNSPQLDNLQEAIEMAEHAEVFGPFVDPTLYREKGRGLKQDIALMRAVLALRRALPEIASIR